MKKLIKGLYDIWLKERPAQLAAALSYYGMFSFAPVIFITLWVADFFLRGSQSSTQLYERLAVMLGEDAAALIQEMVMQITPAAQQTPSLVTWISIGALLFAAAGAFNQLQYALNRIWNVSAPINMKASTQIKRWLLFIVMVFGLGFLLVAAAMLNTVLAWLASYLRISSNYEAGSVLILFLLLSLSCAVVYKYIPNVKITWRDVWIGAFVTACLLMLGGYLIGWYFRVFGIGSAFQAAGGFVVILVAIYILAQIFLVGAMITRVYTHQYGSKKPTA